MSQQKSYFEQQVDKIKKEVYQHEHYYKQVRHSRAYMAQHLSEKIELEKLATTAFMSRYHFIRVFKQVYGLTPREYLKELRINKAKELLKDGLSVTQACFAVGYESLPTFSRAFKIGTGHSPRAYQELNKSNRE